MAKHWTQRPGARVKIARAQRRGAATRRQRRHGGGVVHALPTTNGAASHVKPRALKPLSYACPHCGRPVVLPR